MADAYLDTVETYEAAKVLLPRGVSITGSGYYGGVLRLSITGKELTEGMGYQLVSTDGPLLRCIELFENQVPEDVSLAGRPQARKAPEKPNKPTYDELAAEVAKMDPDGDGKVGGSAKKTPKGA